MASLLMIISQRIVAVAITSGVCCVMALAAEQPPQPQPVPQETWAPFMEWAQAQKFEQIAPAAVLQNYRAHLEGQGRHSTADLERIINALDQLVARSFVRALPQQREFDTLRSNKAYERGASHERWPLSPNDFLARMAKSLAPGKSLDCGTGSGRDAVWLAQQGWDAAGLDAASQGIALALENAKAAGVQITGIAADAMEFDWGHDRYDLISNIHSCPPRPLIPKIRAALKVGGVYITEGGMLHRPDDRAKIPGGTIPNEPLEWFKDGWRILHYEDALAGWDCAGCGGAGKTRVYRLMAQKVNF